MGHGQHNKHALLLFTFGSLCAEHVHGSDKQIGTQKHKKTLNPSSKFKEKPKLRKRGEYYYKVHKTPQIRA
jgi:hypothetical protein